MTGDSPYNAALEGLGRGWSVIPLRPRDKRPLIGWEEFQHRRAERAEVEDWFRRWPDANLGLVTGVISGLVVLDVDSSHGGNESLAALESRHGALPATVEARTGGGGRHVYFSHPGGIVRNRAAIVPGIDLRGDGGYVVLAPSLHPCGRRYQWLASRGPDQQALALMPSWLRILAVEANPRIGRPLAHWRQLIKTGVEQGQRNATLASLCGHLLWHGLDPVVALDMLLCWNRERCRPPLPDDEVARVVESISHLHHRHLNAQQRDARDGGARDDGDGDGGSARRH